MFKLVVYPFSSPLHGVEVTAMFNDVSALTTINAEASSTTFPTSSVVLCSFRSRREC